jgi:hypothetical protein
LSFSLLHSLPPRPPSAHSDPPRLANPPPLLTQILCSGRGAEASPVRRGRDQTGNASRSSALPHLAPPPSLA